MGVEGDRKTKNATTKALSLNETRVSIECMAKELPCLLQISCLIQESNGLANL